MTAKEYLREIKTMDMRIDQKQVEYETLLKRRTHIKGIDYAADRVQTSHDNEGFATDSDRLIDLQKEINAEIDQFYELRHKRINQIQALSKSEYIDILFRRYIQYQSFETISAKIGMTYNWVCHLHGQALREFEYTFLKQHNLP